MRPQERAPDYQVVAAWAGFLLLIGAGAFVVGMAIHNEATADALDFRGTIGEKRSGADPLSSLTAFGLALQMMTALFRGWAGRV